MNILFGGTCSRDHRGVPAAGHDDARRQRADPVQMEYERQQREYRRQLEQQQQEQQRLQQQMNENARRQQEQSRQLNAPASQNPAPAYQGASPRTAARRQATQVDVAAAIAAADWEPGGDSLKGEHDFYFARSTISRSGDFAKMWEMIDHKSAVVIDGKPALSMRNFEEYDCKAIAAADARRLCVFGAYRQGHLGGLGVLSVALPLGSCHRRQLC